MQVVPDADSDPLSVGAVSISTQAEQQLRLCWAARNPAPDPGALYRRPDDFLQLVRQTLSRDIRSAHQRAGSSAGIPRSSNYPSAGRSMPQRRPRLASHFVEAFGELEPKTKRREASFDEWVSGTQHVVLQHVDVSYDFDRATGGIIVRSAHLLDGRSAATDE